MTTILIIEDEVNLNKILADYLRHNGFQPVSAHTGKEGLQRWQESRPALVLLDLNLPDMDGLDVARTIRKSGQTPIIMVTARQEELDRLIGLELGADDYITKPFSPREVVARVKAVLRRCMSHSHNEEIIQLGNKLDLKLALWNSEAPSLIDFRGIQFAHPTGMQAWQVFSRLEYSRLPGACYAGYERTIDVHIMNLRQKIKQIDPTPFISRPYLGVIAL